MTQLVRTVYQEILKATALKYTEVRETEEGPGLGQLNLFLNNRTDLKYATKAQIAKEIQWLIDSSAGNTDFGGVGIYEPEMVSGYELGMRLLDSLEIEHIEKVA